MARITEPKCINCKWSLYLNNKYVCILAKNEIEFAFENQVNCDFWRPEDYRCTDVVPNAIFYDNDAMECSKQKDHLIIPDKE